MLFDSHDDFFDVATRFLAPVDVCQRAAGVDVRRDGDLFEVFENLTARGEMVQGLTWLLVTVGVSCFLNLPNEFN